MPEQYYEHLDWDTIFFGFKVAKIHLKNNDKYEFLKILDDLRVKKYSLVYMEVEGDQALLSKEILLNNGELVDDRAVYIKELKYKEVNDYDNKIVSRYLEDDVSEELNELALASSQYSRFRVDSNFPNELCDKMYHEWIKNILSTGEVFITKHGNRITGMVALTHENDTVSIELIAVNGKYRNRNFGSSLMNSVCEYARKYNCNNVRVVTQKQNIVAKRFYESSGYRSVKGSSCYHFWL